MKRKNRIVGACALFLLTFACYSPALWNGYIWDDDVHVTHNATLRDLEGLKRIWTDRSATPQYYPLLHTAFWVEHHLWGLQPFGYHFVNIILHAANAVLLWHLLRRLQIRGAWLAAAIFSMHPVHVESVAWISELKNVLSALMYLGALLAYMRFQLFEEKDGVAEKKTRWGYYALSLGLFLGALLSKTVTCLLPIALLILMWWRRGKVRFADLLPLVPFIALGAIFGLHTVWLELAQVGARGEPWEISFLHRIAIAGRAILFYAWKLFLPVNLTFIYPRWELRDATWPSLAFFPCLCLILFLVLYLMRKRWGAGAFVASLLFVISLFPALGFFNVYPFQYSFVADHFQYLASIAIIALGVAGLLMKVRRREFRTGLACILLATFGTMTARQTLIYRDEATLWRDTLSKNPASWMAHNNFGVVLSNRGAELAAMRHLEESIRINPRFPDSRNNLGVLLARNGRQEEALHHHAEAIRLAPQRAEFRYAAGNLLADMGRYEEAIVELREALRLKPEWIDPAHNLARILATTGGNAEEAVQLAEFASAAHSHQDLLALDTLAAAYANAKRFEDALTIARRAYHLALTQKNLRDAQEIHSHIQFYLRGEPLRAGEKK